MQIESLLVFAAKYAVDDLFSACRAALLAAPLTADSFPLVGLGFLEKQSIMHFSLVGFC